MPIALRARRLWKSYVTGVVGCSARVWVLRGVNLSVERGECVAVLGARASGTTTLLHCLAGLRAPDAGSIESEETPCLLGTGDEREARPGTSLLLVDDGFDPRRRVPRSPIVPEARSNATTIVIATHELARVRDVADRILLLHQGGLFPLDHLTPARRVAERLSSAAVMDAATPRRN